MIFGKNFNATAYSNFICFKKMEFGDNCLVSWNCNFLDTDFHKIYDEKLNMINPNKDIYIGDNTWISSGTTVLKGSYIPNNCVIAANSTITKKLKEQNGIYVSNDLKKENIIWKY